MAEVLAPIPSVRLMDSFYVQFEAISPTNGAAIAGVTVANATLFVEDDGQAVDTNAYPLAYVQGPNSGAV